MDRFVVTGNYSDSPFAIDISQLLGVPYEISDLVSLKTYANSEFCPRYISDEEDLENIGNGLKGRTVIISSTSDLNRERNNLAMRNCILARAAKDNGADRVILVEPDLFYSAQDRGPHRMGELEADRTPEDLKKFDGQAFTARLYADMLKLSGVDTVITVHNHSIKVQQLFAEVFPENFYNLIPTDVYAHYIKNSNFVQTGKNGDNLVLVAPDKGAKPFVDMVWDALDLPECKRLIMDKERSGERDVKMKLSQDSELTLEEIEGKDIIILDDMVRTGTTIVRCCQYLKGGNPNRVCFGVTHFYSSAEAREKLNSPFIDEIMTTSTQPPIMNRDQQGRLRKKLVVLKLGKWMSRFLMKLVDREDTRFEKDFYAIDMSSKNPRWPPPSMN
jgi:ribose-phosphate pyrophosphokinase